MGAIMDYAVEEDLSEEKAKDLEMDSCQPEFPDIEHPGRFTCCIAIVVTRNIN